MRRFAIGLALLALTPACYSKYEGEMMRKDVDQLKIKVDEMEKRSADLTQATTDAKAQLEKLKGLMEEATRLVTRNSADFGLKVEKMQQDLATLMGRVDEISHSLEAMQKDYQAWRAAADVRMEALGGKGPGTLTTGPADKDSLFTQAKDKLAAGDHEDARRLLRQFITQYPQDARAAQAQLLHGESYFMQKKYAAAIGEFQKVIDQYPKSPAVEEAMFKIGLSFLELKYCTDAKTFLGETLKRYPRSSHAAQIHKALADIQRNAKNRKACSN
ncbi:MAG TPA: tol-pal system protein YbgF [Polyangia bacterium]|nr:tol-pal system protein YbgF [Polyangia bacterium]